MYNHPGEHLLGAYEFRHVLITDEMVGSSPKNGIYSVTQNVREIGKFLMNISKVAPYYESNHGSITHTHACYVMLVVFSAFHLIKLSSYHIHTETSVLLKVIIKLLKLYFNMEFFFHVLILAVNLNLFATFHFVCQK